MDIRDEIQKVLLTLVFAKRPYSNLSFADVINKTIRPKESYYDVFEAQNNYDRGVFTYKLHPRQYGHLRYMLREYLKMPHTVHVDITEDELREAFQNGNAFCNYINELCDKVDKERMKQEWMKQEWKNHLSN